MSDIMITKCSDCGAEIVFPAGKAWARCPYCAAPNARPRSEASETSRMKYANERRNMGEFREAEAAYREVLQITPDEAEARWGILLCKYGVIYVENGENRECLITCRRSVRSSVRTEPDYLRLLETAEPELRAKYERDAAYIDGVQAKIRLQRRQEKPYDIFLCYKETGENGAQTEDSLIARNIYNDLTRSGYRVFFAPESLKEKAGENYEAAIFTAIESSAVMLALGTKKEYFESTWVRSEWRRYLEKIDGGEDKYLFPLFREAGDQPVEFTSRFLQGYRMEGPYMLDLKSRLIRIIRPPEEPPPLATGGPTVLSLVKRARLFMEDGDFSSAREYLDRALDIDPEYAPAYLCKVCAALGFRMESDLGEATFLYDSHPDWKRALRFASPQQKIKYEDCCEQAKARVTGQMRDRAYDCAMEMAVNPGADRPTLEKELKEYRASCETYGSGRADGARRRNARENEAQFHRAFLNQAPGSVSEQAYRAAADMFRAIRDEDANARAGECLALAKLAGEKAVYDQTATKSDQRLSAAQRNRQAERFQPASDSGNARAQAESCRGKAAALKINASSFRQVGNYVTFGTYPQTADGTDNTPIEWLVLDYDAANHRVLLISRYGLDAKPYHAEFADITWENCTLRAWLNSTFYNKAFSANERSAILLTNVDNGSSQGYSKWSTKLSTSGGNNTQDRVFLLSYTEANKYLGVTFDNRKNTKSRVVPTAYALKQGAHSDSNFKTADGKATGWWWLRSPGRSQHYAAYVLDDGSLSYLYVLSDSGCVRPALWINLESDIF